MTVNMKRTLRRQTVNHFIHTFMKDYDTEKAADCTMKSKYVPRNLKMRLVAAMSQCDAADRVKIERVARLGMFIDNSCNELVYYNAITTAVVRWTVSLYVDSAEVKRLFEIVMEDVGRICDDDIHFIMEKYRYLEQTDGTAESEAGGGSLFGLLGARKHSPDMSLIRYYGNCLWLRVLRAVLHNSGKLFNFDSLFTSFVDPVEGTSGTASDSGLDKEASKLYDEFREHRTDWLKALTKNGREKIEKSDLFYKDTGSSDDGSGGDGRRATARSRSRPPRPPPDVLVTPFDDSTDRDSSADFTSEMHCSSNDESDNSEAETVLRSPYAYDIKRHRPTAATVVSRTGVGVGDTNTTVLARITREKKIHILDDKLKSVLVEETTSKAMSTQRGSRNTGSSATSFESVFRKCTLENPLQIGDPTVTLPPFRPYPTVERAPTARKYERLRDATPALPAPPVLPAIEAPVFPPTEVPVFPAIETPPLLVREVESGRDDSLSDSDEWVNKFGDDIESTNTPSIFAIDMV